MEITDPCEVGARMRGEATVGPPSNYKRWFRISFFLRVKFCKVENLIRRVIVLGFFKVATQLARGRNMMLS